MKVPCTECKKLCKRKVVNRGTENVNRIYYKCEECNHKVGWEDELLAGAKPWSKKSAAPAQKPTAPTATNQHPPAAAAPPLHPPPSAQATVHPTAPAPPVPSAQAQPAPAVPAQPAPAAPPPAPGPRAQRAPARNDAADDSEVEFVYERSGHTAKHKGRGAAAAAAATAAPNKPGTAHALSPDSCDGQGEQAGLLPQQLAGTRTRAHVKASTSASAQQQAQQQPQAQSAKQPPVAAQTTPVVLPQRSQHGATPPSANGRGTAEEAVQAAAATKRKFDEAFTTASGRAPKRPAHDSPAVQSGTAAGAAFSPRAATANETTARANGVPAAGGVGAAASGAGQAGPAAAAAGAASTPVARHAPAGKADGVCIARIHVPGVQVGGTAAAPDRQAAGVAASGMPTAASTGVGLGPSRPGIAGLRSGAPLGIPLRADGGDGFSPGARPTIRVTSEVEELLRQEVRKLRKDVAVFSAQLKEELARSQNSADTIAGLRARLEPLERENRELRLKQQSAGLREKQLVEQLNMYIARERAQQQAQQARAQAQAQAAQAAQAAQDQFFAYTWFQQRQQAAQQQQQQGAQQNPFQDYPTGAAGAAGYGGAGAGAAAGGAAADGAGAGTAHARAGHHRSKQGGAGATGTGGASHQGSAAGAAGAGGAGHQGSAAGAGAAGAGHHQHHQPHAPKDAAPPQDDPVIVAFALSSPPALDETATVRSLKQFLAEAGTLEAAVRRCAEKAELLGLARERLNSWEIRRAVACSKLMVRGQGDLALFRITAPGQQRAALVKAYRDLMLRLHPDKNPGDELATPAFQYLQEAYKRLMALFGG